MLIKAGTVIAYKTGYTVTDYVAINPVTVDGMWTDPDEWTDADERQLDGDLNATFRLKYISSYPDYVYQYYIIEFFDDTTNDAGDYCRLCYASAAELYGVPIGGTTPQTDCDRFDYVGHDAGGFAYYVGDGAAWVASQAATWNTNVFFADTIGTSPMSDTPHLIIEVMIEHITFVIQPEFWLRVAVYDESNAGSGVQSWPEGSVDVPNDWGLLNSVQESIPEGLTFGVMVLLTSVSVLVGSHYLWKRSKKREK